MSDERQNILDLQQVSVRYTIGDTEISVLEELSLGVERGAFLSLMGPSGSGKSTLLNVISGLLPPNAGQVFFEGESLYALDDHARTLLRRQKMGIVFQFFNLLPSLDVFDNVALPLLIAGQDPRRYRGRLHELLDLVGLNHRANHHPSQLSGGELQRVTLARALVREPRILLADEPTGNVSAKMGEEIMALLNRINRELGQTIFLVTHNHRDAARGSHVVFLHGGGIAADHQLLNADVNETRILSVLQELEI